MFDCFVHDTSIRAHINGKTKKNNLEKMFPIRI